MSIVQARSRPCNPQNLPGGERREVTPELQSSLLLWHMCSYTHNVHTHILPRSFVCRLREALFPTDFSGDTATCPKPQIQHLQSKMLRLKAKHLICPIRSSDAELEIKLDSQTEPVDRVSTGCPCDSWRRGCLLDGTVILISTQERN